MFVTVAVVMCLQLAPGPLHLDRDCAPEEMRVDEIVTDTDLEPDLSFQDCMLGQAKIVKWKDEHPIYHADKWRIARTRCVPGHYELPKRV